MNKQIIVISLLLCSCSNISFSPINWFEVYDNEPKTSATETGDCTTNAQCEELVPGQNLYCYKRNSYTGICSKIIQ